MAKQLLPIRFFLICHSINAAHFAQIESDTNTNSSKNETRLFLPDEQKREGDIDWFMLPMKCGSG